MNQCDGCRRGLPVVDGVHQGTGYDMIGCTAKLYTGDSDMLVNIDGVTKTLKLVTWRGPNLGSQWNEMGDVNGTMRPVAAHRLPWHRCVAGAKFSTNGHEYEIISLR